MKRVAIAFCTIVTIVAPSGPATAETGCIVYQHRNFGGAAWRMERDSFLQMGGERIGITRSHGKSPIGYYRPDWNDQISSFKVFRGCTITLWEHVAGTGGGGARFRSTRSYSYVGDRWNDKASWVNCSCEPTQTRGQWAAVAADGRGRWGYAAGFRNQAAARTAAVKSCGGGTCRVRRAAKARCVAYAESRSRGYWFGLSVDSTRARVTSVALRGCNRGAPKGTCRIVRTVCQ